MNFSNLLILAIFSLHNAHAKKRLPLNYRLKFCHQHLSSSAIWGHFLSIFALDKLNVHHISTSGLVSCVVHTTVKISSKFEVDMTVGCIVIAFWLLIHYMTLRPRLFDLVQWSYMAYHVMNPSTKFEDPMAIRSWVKSCDISRRISLTVHLKPLRMRGITWYRANFSNIFEIPDTDLPIHYNLQLVWLYD